jgi:hypothetical protein
MLSSRSTKEPELMSRRHEEAIRLGIRVLVAAALTGLVVLLLEGRAHSAEMVSDGTFETLLDSPLASSSARLEEAEELLERGRRRQWEKALRQVLEVAWTTGSERSVQSVFRGARDLYRTVRTLREQTPIEREVFALLDSEIRAGSGDERLRSLHAELLERERQGRLRARLADTRRALDEGDLARARIRLALLRERAPTHPEVTRLEAAWVALDRRERGVRESLLQVVEQSRPGEVSRAAALLLDEVPTGCGSSRDDGQASLLCAASLYGAGARQEARTLLARLARGEGSEAETASQWLAEPHLFPERVWRSARRRGRVRRVLGWLGGRSLEDRGLDVSSRGLRAWRGAVSPLNLGLSVPLRIARGRTPHWAELRHAARFYLERDPHGRAAGEAREWLRRTSPDAVERRRLALYEDGVLQVPKARTRYSPVYARPILVAAELLQIGQSTVTQALAQRLAAAEAVVFTPAPPQATIDGLALSQEEATQVLHALAGAIEEGHARSLRGSTAEALDALRRLTGVVRSGHNLHAHPWRPAPPSPRKQTVLSLLEGDATHLEQVALHRGDDDLEVQRSFFGRNIPCQSGLVCLDRARPIQGRLYGSLGLEGDARLGVETRIQGASLRLEVSETGPFASLVLPVGALLGIEQWVPLEASVRVSLAGISVAPRLDPRD